MQIIIDSIRTFVAQTLAESACYHFFPISEFPCMLIRFLLHSSSVRSDNKIRKSWNLPSGLGQRLTCFFSSYRTNPTNFDKFPFDLMIFYNHYIITSMLTGMISGRIAIKFKKDIKEFFI